MLRKSLVAGGVVGGGLYAHYRFTKHNDAPIRRIAYDAELSGWVNAINYLGYLGDSFLDRPVFPLNPRKEFESAVNFDEEVELVISSSVQSGCMSFKNKDEKDEFAKKVKEQFRTALDLLARDYAKRNVNTLTPIGRLVSRLQSKTFQYKARNTWISYVKDNASEILSKECVIDRPNGIIFIAGMHRTGSTLLQELLALDPTARSPRLWEMMVGTPPCKSEEQLTTDSRIQSVDTNFEKSSVFYGSNESNMSEFQKLHRLGAANLEEDVMVLMQFFERPRLYLLHDKELLDHVDNSRELMRYSCSYLHLWFKMAEQYFSPKHHWVSKNPEHSKYLEELLEEFPNAKVVITHRNPRSVVLSWLKVLTVPYYHVYCNDFDSPDLVYALTERGIGEAAVIEQKDNAMSMLLARRRMRKLDARKERSQFYDVSFSKLMKEPVGVVRDIYRHFGYTFTPEHEKRILEYLEQHPRDEHGKPRNPVTLQTALLTPEFVDDEFKEYIAEYGKYF